jgi:hypothetical protein
MRAQRLLEQTGSPDLARHAADLATGEPLGSPLDEFARGLGFASYLSLFEDSTRLAAEPGKQWFVTAIRNKEWILWNDADLVVIGKFATKDDAERALAGGPGAGSI